jgi:hypothetical protein
MFRSALRPGEDPESTPKPLNIPAMPKIPHISDVPDIRDIPDIPNIR